MSASTLSMDFGRRFGGIARLYGAEGAQNIRNAHVAVIGLGGVGSWAAEALARSGVGQLTLIDLDQVAESNINRQAIALEDTLGMAKVEAMQQRILQINPACEVHTVEDFLTFDNCAALLSLGLDALIDGCDDGAAKTAMALWSRTTEVPLVVAGAAGGKRQAHKVELADLSGVTHDPLLARLRYRLRREHGFPKQGVLGVTCVFSREPVARAVEACGTDGTLNCAGYGSFAPVTASFGHCAAGWVVNHLAEKKLKKTL